MVGRAFRFFMFIFFLFSSPADVNFALELSDLRHRHGFQIILVHKNQASEALLHHAHELICFEEFISDLPPRLPLKVPVRFLTTTTLMCQLPFFTPPLLIYWESRLRCFL